MSSGMLSIQCERFCETLGLKYLPQKQATHIIEDYSRSVESERIVLCSDALREEILCSSTDRIDIVSDARHSPSMNSRYTDVVCVGYKSQSIRPHSSQT